MSTQPLATRALSPETTNYLKQITAPVKVPTMDDMLRDFDTFKSYVQLGAFESDMSAGDMIYEGGKQMVKDSWNWLSLSRIGSCQILVTRKKVLKEQLLNYNFMVTSLLTTKH